MDLSESYENDKDPQQQFPAHIFRNDLHGRVAILTDPWILEEVKRCSCPGASKTGQTEFLTVRIMPASSPPSHSYNARFST